MLEETKQITMPARLGGGFVNSFRRTHIAALAAYVVLAAATAGVVLSSADMLPRIGFLSPSVTVAQATDGPAPVTPAPQGNDTGTPSDPDLAPAEDFASPVPSSSTGVRFENHAAEILSRLGHLGLSPSVALPEPATPPETDANGLPSGVLPEPDQPTGPVAGGAETPDAVEPVPSEPEPTDSGTPEPTPPPPDPGTDCEPTEEPGTDPSPEPTPTPDTGTPDTGTPDPNPNREPGAPPEDACDQTPPGPDQEPQPTP